MVGGYEERRGPRPEEQAAGAGDAFLFCPDSSRRGLNCERGKGLSAKGDQGRNLGSHLAGWGLGALQ